MVLGYAIRISGHKHAIRVALGTCLGATSGAIVLLVSVNLGAGGELVVRSVAVSNKPRGAAR